MILCCNLRSTLCSLPAVNQKSVNQEEISKKQTFLTTSVLLSFNFFPKLKKHNDELVFNSLFKPKSLKTRKEKPKSFCFLPRRIKLFNCLRCESSLTAICRPTLSVITTNSRYSSGCEFSSGTSGNWMSLISSGRCSMISFDGRSGPSGKRENWLVLKLFRVLQAIRLTCWRHRKHLNPVISVQDAAFNDSFASRRIRLGTDHLGTLLSIQSQVVANNWILARVYRHPNDTQSVLFIGHFQRDQRTAPFHFSRNFDDLRKNTFLSIENVTAVFTWSACVKTILKKQSKCNPPGDWICAVRT